MSLITTLPDRLCEWFSDMSEFSNYSFCTAFPTDSKATPLTNPVIVFGISSLVILDNTTDESGTVATDSRLAQEVFSISIHTPRSEGGGGCNAILDRIIDLILFDTPLIIIGVESTETTYVRNTDSLNLKASFTVTQTIEKGTNYPAELII